MTPALLISVVLGGAALGLTVRAMVLLAAASGLHWWAAAVLGALAGVVVAAGWQYGGALWARTRISKVAVPLPGGSRLELALDPDAKHQLWRLFVEMASRVATRPLAPGEGLLRAALESLHGIFERARTDLATVPPRASAEAGTPPHIYVLRVLNDDLRPCLARWHPRIEAWARSGRPETDWPLAPFCRADIEATRQRVVLRVRQLGEALGIADLDLILPHAPAVTTELTAASEIEARERTMLPPEVIRSGWKIYVEAETRIATQPLDPGTGLLTEAVASLYALFGIIRAELKEMPPPRDPSGADTVQRIAIEMLNDVLRPFLARWRRDLTRLAKTGADEADWDRAEECRADLETLRLAFRERMVRLAGLIAARG